MRLPYYTFALVFFIQTCLLSQEPILSLEFDEASGTTFATEAVSGAALAIRNRVSRPERIPAPNHAALRFDGYSTYLIGNDRFDFRPQVSDAFSVEVWHATEAFNASPAGVISQMERGRGFQLAIDPHGVLIFTVHVDGARFEVRGDTPLPVYQWNHLVAQVDGQAGFCELYLNGSSIARVSIPVGGEITLPPASTPLLVGRTNELPSVDGFVTSTLNGALDAVRLYASTFTETEVQDRFSAVGVLETDLVIDPTVRHPDDHLRPRYHFMPSTLWANEAYGFTWYGDRYHLFFQKNPNANILNFMHWGHLSSPDLVEWKEERIPLRPQPGWSSVGAWSGTTFFDLDSGEPIIAFTGVNGAFAGIGIATTDDPDLIEWKTMDRNPVIEQAPLDIPNLDFRDPYIWTEGDIYYMVVGSGRADKTGGLLMSYTSDDYINWTPIDPIFEAPSAATSGTFWEMPYFAPLNDTAYLLVVTPQFQAAPARTIYWVGSFDGKQFKPYDPLPKNFELIERNLLSPAIGRDELGRLSYIGIIPEDRSVRDQILAGWRQTFSVPRVLRLLDDGRTLGHYPHPNLCRGRESGVEVVDRTVAAGTSDNLAEYRGTQSELHFDLYTGNTDRFTIEVFRSEDGGESTGISFDKVAGTIAIDRRNSSPYETAEVLQTGTYAFKENDSLSVSVFIDNSIVEVFVDNLVVLSARVYPGVESNQLDLLVTDGTLQVARFQAWNRGVKEQSFPKETCPPQYLPDELFTATSGHHNQIPKLSVYPNPATNRLTIDLPSYMHNGQITYRLFDANGKQLYGRTAYNLGQQLVIDKLVNLVPGIVFGVITNAAGNVLRFNVVIQ